MFIAYYEMMDNKNITDHKTFLRNYISENGLMPLVARTNYNILDKKIFFKSAAELIDKAALDEISLNKVKQ